LKKKIRVVETQVKKAEDQSEAVKETEALGKLKAEERAEEQRLFQDARAAMEAHLAADARWTEKQHEAVGEQSRAEELREVAKRLHGEATVVEAAASAVDKRATVLSEQAVKLGDERAVLEQRWSEAVEQWEKFRYSLGLPFYDPEVGPPAWFTSPYEQQGLSKLFSER
jgi:hypothetical protein